MWWSGKGGNELAKRFGYDLAHQQSGHFSRHLRKVMGFLEVKRKLLYKLMMPGSSTKADGRMVHEIATFVPHERLDADLCLHEGFAAELLDAIEGFSLPPCYKTHRVVRESAARGELCVCLSLFVDGVQYSLTDTVVGFWLIHTMTGKRYLFCAIRKKLF